MRDIVVNANFKVIYDMYISVVALNGLFDTGLTAVLDAFSTANSIAVGVLAQAAPFQVTIVGVRRKVRSALGLSVPVVAASSGDVPDWVIVPALKATTPAALMPALERSDVRHAAKLLRDWSSAGALIGAACIGTFILAEAGLLDGREATTTWSLSPLFRQRYPKIELDEARMLVPTAIGVTAGSAMGHLDLALWIIQRSSPDLAALVARYLLADIRTSQAPYIIPSHLAQSDELIIRFERWARGRLQAGFSLQDAAKDLAISPRSLQRRTQVVLGKSPLAYFQDLRIERAQSLLQGGGYAVDAIAAEVGYVDGATLRSLLRQRLGRGVRELRGEMR